MFKRVSMYFSIIVESVEESKYFLAMVLVLILSFTLSVYILDQIQQ